MKAARFSIRPRGLLPVLAVTLALAAPQATAQGPGSGVLTGSALAMKSTLPQLNGFRQALAAAASEDPVVAAFYRARDFAPYWTETGEAGAARRQILLTALDTAPMHALPVGRYDAGALRATFAALRTEGDRGRLEVAMTRALMAFAHDLQSGVLEPRRIDPGLVREVPRRDPAAMLEAFVADPAGTLQGLAPKNPEYARLVEARQRLLVQMAAGGWGAPLPDRALKPGDTGPAVVALRDRLGAMGYMGRSVTQTYDAGLQAGVRAFQFAHGMTADGIAGRDTVAEINRPIDHRLRAVTVALERERWANIERGKRHIWVNLTDFTAKIVDDGKVTFATRAVIGATQPDKRTPEFSHLMTYMEVNPDWTVPGGIIRRDYLPRLRANPGALAHLQVIDRSGRVVPRSQINFANYTERNFPYNLRQPPGPSNALGRVKFMFPNPYAIYLHDTPEKHLFSRESRTYSSGCVRLNDPFDFAYELLSRQEADPKRVFHQALDRGRQERIFLKEPVPIHLDYRTAFTDVRGQLHFRRDMYGRDAAIHEALVRAGVTIPRPES